MLPGDMPPGDMPPGDIPPGDIPWAGEMGVGCKGARDMDVDSLDSAGMETGDGWGGGASGIAGMAIVKSGARDAAARSGARASDRDWVCASGPAVTTWPRADGYGGRLFGFASFEHV